MTSVGIIMTAVLAAFGGPKAAKRRISLWRLARRVGIVGRKIRRVLPVVPPALPPVGVGNVVRPSVTAGILLALAVLPGRAWAFGDRSTFPFAVIRHSGNFNPRPTGLRRISWE